MGVTEDDPNSLTGWLRNALRPRWHPGRPCTRASGHRSRSDSGCRLERELAALGGLDLVVLGLGPNGHVAYNEPGSTADSRTRVVDLTPESLAQASAYWQDTVPIPDKALTIGIGTLLEAKKIVLLVTGEAKAEVLRGR